MIVTILLLLRVEPVKIRRFSLARDRTGAPWFWHEGNRPRRLPGHRRSTYMLARSRACNRSCIYAQEYGPTQRQDQRDGYQVIADFFQ